MYVTYLATQFNDNVYMRMTPYVHEKLLAQAARMSCNVKLNLVTKSHILHKNPSTNIIQSHTTPVVILRSNF